MYADDLTILAIINIESEKHEFKVSLMNCVNGQINEVWC